MDHKSFVVSPERLERWLDRGGPFTGTTYTDRTVRFDGPDTVHCDVPFPPIARTGSDPFLASTGSDPFFAVTASYFDGFVPGPLLAHVRRDRRVGVLLVRLGGYACGIFEGAALVESKVGSRYVHGRNRAGGQSQRRFERRRGEQAREALRDAADTAARVLVPRAASLDAVVLGGDRSAADALRDDRRLEPVFALAVERFLGDVPDPRLTVLRETPDAFRAVVIRVSRAGT